MATYRKVYDLKTDHPDYEGCGHAMALIEDGYPAILLYGDDYQPDLVIERDNGERWVSGMVSCFQFLEGYRSL
jgi:hypothetical protein